MPPDLARLIDEFPLAPPGETDPSTIRRDLDQCLQQLLEIVGYPKSVLHHDVALDIPDSIEELTDVEFRSPLHSPLYVAEDQQSSPYLVGKGYRWMAPSPFRGSGSHGLYEAMRVHHETAEPEMTVFLTPFDLLIYDGTGSLFQADAPNPMEHYSLHEAEPETDYCREMKEFLRPPERLAGH